MGVGRWIGFRSASHRETVRNRVRNSPGEFVDKLARVCPVGSEISDISEGSWGLWKGYYARIYVWDADTWKIRVEYVIPRVRLAIVSPESPG